jgi:hypothetical protein
MGHSFLSYESLPSIIQQKAKSYQKKAGIRRTILIHLLLNRSRSTCLQYTFIICTGSWSPTMTKVDQKLKTYEERVLNTQNLSETVINNQPSILIFFSINDSSFLPWFDFFQTVKIDQQRKDLSSIHLSCLLTIKTKEKYSFSSIST